MHRTIIALAFASHSLAQTVAAPEASSGNRVEREIGAARVIELEEGESRLVEMSNPTGRVSVANPEIADVKVITPTQLHITANKLGATDISVWDKGDRVFVMDVKVNRNLAKLREQLKNLFPGDQIDATAAGDLVILSGEVGDVRTPQRAVEVASLHAPRVANLVRVRGNQQVQLEMRFAEVSRTGLREMGVNFFYQDAGRVGGMSAPDSNPGNFFPREPRNIPPYMPGTGPVGSGLAPGVQQPASGSAFNLFFSNTDGFPFSTILSILAGNGLAKVMAEPTLVAMSGQEAKFLAGGEVPIPFATALGQITVEFKKFGIQLTFNPTVLSDDTVHLKMATEVSEPDPAVGITVAGFSIPGFSSRQSETTIRLKDGQSFAIAGLLSDKIRSLVNKVPLLGDLPILGALFRSTQFKREETELLVVVTVRLVKPVAPHELPALPGEDEVNDPDDFELFLLGRTTRKWGESEDERPSRKTPERGPAGEVGFGR